MKKLPLILVLILVIASTAFVVKAHPGRTDADGGHTDHSTGEYHYHHGYPEHGHYDMDGDGDIDCPYNFDDQAGISSGDSSTDSANSNDIINTRKHSPDTVSKVCLSLVVLFPVAFLISMPVLSLVKYIVSCFKAELSDKGFSILMYTVYFAISGSLIYLIIIW